MTIWPENNWNNGRKIGKCSRKGNMGTTFSNSIQLRRRSVRLRENDRRFPARPGFNRTWTDLNSSLLVPWVHPLSIDPEESMVPLTEQSGPGEEGKDARSSRMNPINLDT